MAKIQNVQTLGCYTEQRLMPIIFVRLSWPVFIKVTVLKIIIPAIVENEANFLSYSDFSESV